MSAPRRSLPAALAALALAAGLATVPALPAAADESQCFAIGGVWSDPTCTLATTQTLALPAGALLIGDLVIPAGVTITKTGAGTLTINGSAGVAGSLIISDGQITVSTLQVTGSGSLLIDGTGGYSSGGTVVDGAGASVTLAGGNGLGSDVQVIAGTLTVAAGETLSGNVTNAGTTVIGGGVTGTVTQTAGTLTNTSGTINGAVTITGGTLTNDANIMSAVTLSGGTLANTGPNGRVYSSVAVSGTGVLVNDGTIDTGVTFSGTGNFTGAGTTTPRFAQTSVFSSAAPTAAVIGGTYVPTVAASVGTTTTFGASPAGVCTIAGGTVTFTGIGSCTVTASRAQNGNFAAVAATQTFAVAGQSQTVSFTSPAPTAATVGGTSALAATATSGDPVTFSTLSPAVCSVTGATVSHLAAGTCQVRADQAGSPQYASASAVQSFAVAAVPAAGAGAGGGLADTGVDVLPGILVALLALLTGAGLLVARRLLAVHS